MKSDCKHLSAFETEVLVALYAQQWLFEHGQFSADSTIWSRTEYAVAKPRGILRPSPVRGKMEMPSAFEQRLRAVADHLVKRGLLKRRKLAGFGRQYRETLGYKLHRSQGIDYFLTADGKRLAESLSPRHSDACVVGEEDWIREPERLDVALGVNGTVTLPCPSAMADGMV